MTTKIMNLTGPCETGKFDLAATDLGISAKMPNDQILFVFGDSFSDHVGGTNWRSPTGIIGHINDGSVNLCHAAGLNYNTCEQLLPYPHNAWIKGEYVTTVLPSDLIVLDNTIYMHVMVCSGLHNVVWTEFHMSSDNGVTWQHCGQDIPHDLWNGMFQITTFEDGGDGYIYCFSTGFQRDKGIILSRCNKEDFPDKFMFETWGWNGYSWGWNNYPTEVLPGKFGELNLRKVDDKFVLTHFNEADITIESIIMDSPTDNLYEANKKVLIREAKWGQQHDNYVAQPYGGYAVPGSSLKDFNFVISQWNTEQGTDYRSMLFNTDLTE